jgi:hypothetical protein
MTIAISGTHCSGKSTLIDDFVAAHRDYVYEPEPYEWLDDAHVEPNVDDFSRQLEISVERLLQYPPGSNVIFERSPLDFIAYVLALVDLGRAARDCAWIDALVERAAVGIAQIDLLVILPLNGIIAPESEDPELREAMNERLLELVATDEYSLLGGERPRVIEIQGTRTARLRALEGAMPQ